MTRVAGISGQAMTAVMMVAGLGMLVGNLAGGHLSDRFSPERVARFIQGMICLLLVGIFFAARIDWLVIPLMFLTTASLFGVSSPQQLLILENAPGGEMLGARVDPDRVQPRQRFGRLLRRSADQFRPGASICRPARCGDGPAGLRHVLRLLQSLRSE